MLKSVPTDFPAPLDDRHYRQIVESTLQHAVITCDAAGRVSSWNHGAQNVFGWTPAEMMGADISSLFTPEDIAAGVPEAERTRAQREGRAPDERWHVRKDGSRFWAKGEMRLLESEADGPALLVKVVRDGTAEHGEAQNHRQLALDMQFLARASEELAELSDLPATLETIARLAVPDFADWCTVDLLEPSNTLRRVATAHFDQQKAASAQDLIKRYPPDPRTLGGTWEVLRSGRARLVEELTPESLERGVPDPERRELLRRLNLHSYIAAPLVAHGAPFGVLTFATAESGRRYNQDDMAVAVDLARRAAVAIENAKLLRELRESDRAKDVFMATLAHELRNPLAPIWNGLSIIKRVSGDRLRVEQVSAMIERQVGHLSRLVDDLLDVSRINAGKLDLQKEPTSLARVVAAAVEMTRPQIEAAHHKLSLSFPDEATDVMADPARLSQVFSNLLINAAKYTRRGGRIDMAVEAEPQELVVRIADNGVGIAPEMLDKVFGLFTQVSQQGEPRQAGLGIGLSLVDGLVRLHGGSVEARSEGLNKGCEFIVRLPRLALDATSAPADAGAERDTAAITGRRILVVDDNVDSAATVADLLLMVGNEVDVVHDGQAAVERTSSFRPDIVLLDIGLPDISGYEAARRIRKLEGVRQPTLIALTGWGQQQDKLAAAEAGFDQHWTKPVDPARLMALASR